MCFSECLGLKVDLLAYPAIIVPHRFNFETAVQDNNGQEMLKGRLLGPNIPKSTCDGALQFKARKYD